jgi:hypothetical protein
MDLVDRDQCAALKGFAPEVENAYDIWTYGARHGVLDPNLQDARAAGPSGGQQGPEIHVVREHDMAVGSGPRHEFGVARSRISHRAPMNADEARLL